MCAGAHNLRIVGDALFRSKAPHHLAKLKILLPYFGDLPLRTITKAVVREYRQARHETKTLTEATVNRDVAVLRHLLYWATDEGLLTANPLTRLRLAQERRRPRPVVSLFEEQQLLDHAPTHVKELLILALDTGMRRGELLHQDWQHLDLTRGVLQVTRSKTIQGEGREIPLTARVRALLQARQQTSGLVFMYRQHQIGTIKTAWGSTLKAASIRHIRFHDLRHTFNTRLLEAGVLQEVRKALMGHVSGQGVHGVYTHIELPLKRDAITKLEQWLEHERARQATASAPAPASTPSLTPSPSSPASTTPGTPFTPSSSPSSKED